MATLPQHYLVRTSWVIGAGQNFVRTMAALADRGVEPSVVDDQFGRLTFTDEIAAGHRAPARSAAPRTAPTTSSGDGPATSWADIARTVFAARGRAPEAVRPISTAAYAEGKQLAPRPRHSTLDLAKISATGFRPAPVDQSLSAYLAALDSRSALAGRRGRTAPR